ncbi:Regulator of chromosome condensation (RCC1) repeat, putative [Trypanosoma equiperdum]|uniref:Regulator of chromosome condensation (RCC1) repeat, putative n=1 Tax=Trypanosoma equiperdum TaxID=5694 RepID=A0A1G4IJQ2_TRYEQ|nr:Regulator of chromosome condensation (RCC1) repeat, putative [Trypanosoma equiperdum]
MFFWGSYNFFEPRQADPPNRPPLRYPVYVPPSLSMMADAGIAEPEKILKTEQDDIQSTLQHVDNHRIVVKLIGCGQKHLVGLMGLAPKSSMGSALPRREGAVTSDIGSNVTYALYGMGSNHSGQLGHRLPTYSTTLVKLQFEELLPPGVTVSSIACGDKYTVVSTSDGLAFAAGDNSFSQLGTVGKGLGFAPVRGIHNIKRVFAGGNATFALDGNGQLFSWGEAQYGHLCHGDNGQRLDVKTLKTVNTNVSVPTRIEWFVRRHVTIVDVSVSRSHVVCRSGDEVYTCGDGTYGKLCSGSFESSYLPVRVKFPERTHPERVCAIAAGDDHTLILRESSAVGAVVYYFGKAKNGDGQLIPDIISLPSNVQNIFAGRGTFSAATTSDGLLYVWGKQVYAGLSNGTSGKASRSYPCSVVALESHNITSVAAGATFVVATGGERRACEGIANEGERWDIVIPHDDRTESGYGDSFSSRYESAVQAFLTQYLGPSVAGAYISGIPEAPLATNPNANRFKPIGAHSLTVGQKVRLWMTDVYALASITKVFGRKEQSNHVDISGKTNEEEREHQQHLQIKNEEEEKENLGLSEVSGSADAPGYRFCIEWQRDDWRDEEVTLYSDDETLEETNPNRWQPLWFLYDETAGNYVVGK